MILEGKAALVTGAGGAIGGAISKLLAAHGATVYCLDLDLAKAKVAAEAISSAGGAAYAVAADLTSRDEVHRAMGEIGQRGLDVLVNNAMWIKYDPLEDVTEDVLDRILSIGVKAVAWTTQAFASLAGDRGGSIVNITSTASARPAANQAAYSAAKGALSSLTLQSSIELGSRQIRVNAVAPGAVIHDENRGRLSNDFVDRRLASTPLGRLGTPEDIAKAVVFFASDLSSFITGQELTVDGGRLAAP